MTYYSRGGKKRFSRAEALRAHRQLDVWGQHRIPFSDFHRGMDVELEHADVTGGDPVMTGKIALAHLREDPQYYDKLERMEKGACG
jgi:hypothetical protein